MKAWGRGEWVADLLDRLNAFQPRRREIRARARACDFKWSSPLIGHPTVAAAHLQPRLGVISLLLRVPPPSTDREPFIHRGKRWVGELAEEEMDNGGQKDFALSANLPRSRSMPSSGYFFLLPLPLLLVYLFSFFSRRHLSPPSILAKQKATGHAAGSRVSDARVSSRATRLRVPRIFYRAETERSVGSAAFFSFRAALVSLSSRLARLRFVDE